MIVENLLDPDNIVAKAERFVDAKDRDLAVPLVPHQYWLREDEKRTFKT